MTSLESMETSVQPSSSADGPSSPVVAVVGAGAMGLPMALRLHRHGMSVRAVDLDPARVRQCREAGLTAGSDLALLAGAEVVLVMVTTGPQLLSLLTAPVVTDGALSGSVLVVGSTVGPEAVREAAVLAEQYDIGLVDCPVTGGVTGATTGTLTLLAAGTPATVESLASTLTALGDIRVVGTRPGDGQSLKLVNQMLAGIHLAAAGEAFAFAERLGLDLDTVREVLPTGAAASWMLADRGPRMILPAAQRPTETLLSVFVKDSGLVADAAAAVGAHAPLTEAARTAWREAAELGLGGGDDSGVVEVFRRG
ncbi:NAD(P)-dependent oxidoreductase [Streptomyces sp. NPDC013978]|uniref:NAD(P)-dependent oxidoreductase n=1 Tax=Streptomyces sp. NPDC013978 TaxID=3364869 RepID=UPI0036FE85A4